MFKKPLHTILALTFALLQCVAPLVHAHVDGQLSGLLPPSLSAPHSSDQLTQTDCAITAYESPAITLAHEFQRNDTPAIPQPSLTHTSNVLLVTVAKFLPSAAPATSFFSPYSKSLPQAPPRLG